MSVRGIITAVLLQRLRLNVRLSKLKLAGFKSFVDPTTVLTPGQLVGIVGPNGCGKSNLIDAVRWVLGESRASALRGESMQDVIFNGSLTRKPVSRASVELVFDNADGRAAGQWSQYAEIAVKRLVDRAGGSDYFINNVRVRRKDVIDLLLGTGLGPRAYAIIEQGMISRVIEARPEDVRAFLEEAAGITKYKERRRETEGRLADAADNLSRVDDICSELALQISRLDQQAAVARRYKEISGLLRTRQVLLWRYRYSIAARDQQASASDLGKATVSVEQRNAELTEVEARLLLARDGLSAHADAVSAAQSDLYAIAGEVTRVEAELKRLADSRERLGKRDGELNRELTEWEGRLEALIADEATTVAMKEQAAEITLAKEQLVDEASAARNQAEAAWKDAVAARDAARQAVVVQERRLSVAEAGRSASMRSLDSLEQRRRRIDEALSALQPSEGDRLEELETALEALTAESAEASSQLEAARHEEEQLHETLQQAQAQARAAAKQVTERTAKLQALRGLQARLRDQGNLAGWLKQAGLSDEPALWQSLSVDPGWELAAEAVLRERISAVGPLAEDRLASIAASPAPVTTVILHSSPDTSLRSDANFNATLLRDVVRCSNKVLSAFIDDWLHCVFVVDDLSAWQTLRNRVPAGVTLVTRQGHVLTSTELTLFAPDSRTHGAIERQREIELLEEALLADEARLDGARATEADIAESLESAKQAVLGWRQKGQSFQAALHAKQLDLVRAQQEAAAFRDQNERLLRETAELSELFHTEREHVEAAEKDRIAAAAQLDLERARLQEAEDFGAQTEQRLNDTRGTLALAQRELADAMFALREAESRLSEIARSQELVRSQIEKGRKERDNVLREHASLDESSLGVALKTALDLRHRREAVLAQRRNDQEHATQQVRELDATRLRIEHELNPLREQIGELKLRHQAAELASAQALERLAEQGVDAVLLSNDELAEVRENALNREVARLTRDLEELGPVNLAALQELESATERKHFLDVQHEDLTRAISTLQDAIKRIDRETREQLMETYHVVNKHFGELFPRLFGGGEAQLVLTGEEILDAGIQIVARPPGKKNTSIHLLSGGEKALTAIALVFSMFQLNPAPFCMLDEVDAPLDDANTERYCEMVKHMSSMTQFVFISHSKITMEMARQLVGVTMQEQGVSRVVEVDIAEAMKLVQPAVA